MAKVKFYAQRVVMGKITIEQVPEDIRQQVIEYIENNM